MLFDREEDFAKAYKEQGIKGVCLLYGDESYLIEVWRRRIVERFGGEESFHFQRIDGAKPDLTALYDATQALPAFGGEKCVLLDDLDAAGMSAAELGELCDILADCPEECVLLVTARPPKFDPKKAAGKKLVAAADRSGWAVKLSARSGPGLVKFLQQLAARESCGISAGLCRELLTLAGNDMLTLTREMEKLCAYAGDGEITREQIDAVVTPRTEARVFDLSKAIASGNGQRAMELLRDLFYLRESPVMILATLAMAYTDLYRARIARDKGIPPAEVISKFGYKGREFRVNNAFQSRLSTAALRDSLNLLLDCDRRMKSSSTDERILLEQTVAGLLALRER